MMRHLAVLIFALCMSTAYAQPSPNTAVSGISLRPTPPLSQAPLRIWLDLFGCASDWIISSSVTRTGANIDVAYDVKPSNTGGCFTLPPPYAFPVDVGSFSPGVYQVTAHGTWAGHAQVPLSLTFTIPETPVGAVEYYRAGADHYFVTADPAEISLLDSGAMAGWTKTGASFGVTPPALSVGSPVCRFYGLPEAGLDSHFFSGSAEECAAVRSRFAASWELESPNVFGVVLPAMDGSCPSNLKPVYRLFNNRVDANHRYTTSLAIRYDFVLKGWTAEGYGPDGVVMCAY